MSEELKNALEAADKERVRVLEMIKKPDFTEKLFDKPRPENYDTYIRGVNDGFCGAIQIINSLIKE